VNLDLLDLTKSADNRRCGECTLCCTLLPVKALAKGASERCKHQRGLGCNIYRKEGFPAECANWNCRWLINDDAGDLQRPDRCHYVIDIIPDFITGIDNASGRQYRIPVVQIWIDPRFPDAHEDPALRAWIVRQEHFAALVRFNDRDAIFLLPPHMSDTGEWEVAGRDKTMLSEGRHHPAEVAATLRAAGLGLTLGRRRDEKG
jgi:hypothetical protein